MSLKHTVLNFVISYKINDGDLQIMFKDIIIGNDINYCMGVYIESDCDSIELLQWEL